MSLTFCTKLASVAKIASQMSAKGKGKDYNNVKTHNIVCRMQLIAG